MEKHAYLSLLFVIISLLPSKTTAQNFENTLQLSDGETSPKADLSCIAWLAGHWRGEAFGGITEEIWTPPLGGSMMGAFKLVADSKVVFYELETIIEVEGSLVLKLKHFNADITGWEEKDETVDFRLVKVTRDKIFFEGFTIERISPDEINMYVVVDEGGKKEEVKFNYKRK